MTGQISGALGVRTTLVWAGALGGIVTFAPLLSRRAWSLDAAGDLGHVPEAPGYAAVMLPR